MNTAASYIWFAQRQFSDDLMRELRSYLRHRKNLTQAYSQQILLMQKAFEQMNIKLQDVIADITGKTGTRIIESILSGNHDPEALVTLADGRIKASKEELIKSLTGIWREENIFELRQSYELYQVHKDKIKICNLQIQATLKKMGIRKKTHPQTVQSCENKKEEY